MLDRDMSTASCMMYRARRYLAQHLVYVEAMKTEIVATPMSVTRLCQTVARD